MRSVGVTMRSVVWLGEKKLSRIMLYMGMILLVSIAVILFAFLTIQDITASGHYPTGVTISGVNVAGLTRDQAVRKMKTGLAGIDNKPFAVAIDSEKYQITPSEIGLQIQYQKMADEAYSKAWSMNFFERIGRRFLNRPKPIDVALQVTYDEAQVKLFVRNASGLIERPPQNAFIDVTSGVPVIVPAKDGRQVNYDEALKATAAALLTPERIVNIQVQRTPAALSDKAFGKFIVINIAQHSLGYYDRDKLVVQYPVACGSPSYPSPPGLWKVVGKQRNPSWSNPGSGWAKGMPAYIGPGPGNPLGTRAMPLSASGVLIHGTPSSWSIGSNVSHGCIRMYMKDVEALFEIVDVNTPVYIIKGPGDPGFDVTKTPTWM
jgi:lipoprotein-anchoring transpeptidase ErfK/SrfK